MRKYTATVMTKRGERQVSVLLDERTANVLDEVNDEELTHRYITEEYKSGLIERRETRRHTSLENSLYVIDRNADLDFYVEKSELCSALDMLTDKQREVFFAHVIDGKSFREIGDGMELHKQTVLEIYNAAIKKLKKFLE